MLFILLFTPILADLVPLAESPTVKPEVIEISPKILRQGINLFRYSNFNPLLRRDYIRQIRETRH